MRTAKPTSLAHGVVWFGGGYGLAIVGYLALNATAARLLGASTFGYFVGILTLTTVLGQIGLLGVHRSGLREAARLSHDDVEQLAELRRGVRATTLVSLPAVSVVSGLVTWFLLGSLGTGDRTVMSIGVALLVVLSGLQKVWANYLRGFGHVRFAGLLEGRSGGALVALIQAGLVALVWIFVPSWGLAGALGAVAVGYAIPVLWASRVVARSWAHVSGKGHLLKDLRVVAKRDWRFASAQVAILLNASIEIWIAGALLSRADTSMFGAAQRMSMLVVLPMTAMGVVFSPTISRMVVASDRKHLETLVRTGATLATVATALICLPLLVMPQLVVRIVFGPGFADAAVPVMVLSVAMLLNAVMGLAGLTMSMAHREGTVAWMQWTTLVARVGVGCLVASAFGLEALAVSSAVWSTAFFVGIWVAAWRKLGVNTVATLHPRLSLVRETAG